MSLAVNESERLSEFTANPVPILEKLRQSGEPLWLTAEGQASVVVQDAASYQRMLEAVDRLETIAAVKEGLADAAARRTKPMREALVELEVLHIRHSAGLA
jgi:PHD/YefM family antitoxin component YafN of YafNO toxin-antitoxin module